MARSTTSALVAELEAAVRGGSPQHHTRMLHQITGLFLSEADRLNEQQIGLFDEVLLRLMERLGPRTLAHLSSHICGSSAAPREVVRRLAYHEDGSVAAPVLARSTRLSETDLAAIAGARGSQHLLAISSRPSLDVVITDILVTRGELGVSTALAGNAGARLSEHGYRALLAHAGQSGDVAEKLAVRPDLPEPMLRELVARSSPTIRSRLLKAAAPEFRGRIEAAIRQSDAALPPMKKLDYTAADIRVRDLNRTGRLNDSTISRFALERDHAHIIAALSQRTTVPVAAIDLVVRSRGGYSGIIVACRASRLDWSTAVAIIRSRPDAAMPSKHELDATRPAFENLSCSLALHTLQYWAANETETSSEGPQIPSRAVESPAQGADRAKA